MNHKEMNKLKAEIKSLGDQLEYVHTTWKGKNAVLQKELDATRKERDEAKYRVAELEEYDRKLQSGDPDTYIERIEEENDAELRAEVTAHQVVMTEKAEKERDEYLAQFKKEYQTNKELRAENVRLKREWDSLKEDWDEMQSTPKGVGVENKFCKCVNCGHIGFCVERVERLKAEVLLESEAVTRG